MFVMRDLGETSEMLRNGILRDSSGGETLVVRKVSSRIISVGFHLTCKN